MSTTDQLPTTLRPGPTADHGPDPEDDSGPGSIETVIRPKSGWIAMDWSEMVRGTRIALLLRLARRQDSLQADGAGRGLGRAPAALHDGGIHADLRANGEHDVDDRRSRTRCSSSPGLIFWTYFSGAVTGAGMSLITQQHLLTKVYFPRLFIPIACVGTVLVRPGDLAGDLRHPDGLLWRGPELADAGAWSP